MSTNDAQQLAFDGMAPRKRRKRAPAEKIVAAEDPIAQVVLDVQATHLGQTFDYLVEERWSQAARPGVMVQVQVRGQAPQRRDLEARGSQRHAPLRAEIS